MATQDVLTDPLIGGLPDDSLLESLTSQEPTTVRRHSPLDKKSVLPTGTPGSGSLVNAISRSGDTNDQLSLTQAFLHQKATRPGLSDDMLWELALQYDVNPGGEITELRGTDEPSVGGEKKAYVVGNSDYTDKDVPDLPGAKRDATAMASHYKGKGYKVFKVEDVTADKLKFGIEVFGKLKEGDEGVLYYAGHGLSYGLAGVDYDGTTKAVVRNSVVSAATSKALGAGATLDVVMDACRSGGLQDQMESEFKATATSEELSHVDASTSADQGYGMDPGGFAKVHEHMIEKGKTMSDGWHIRNPDGIEVEEY